MQFGTAVLALAIVARAMLHDGTTPVVTGDLLPRTSHPPLVVRVATDRGLSPSTAVRWSAPDGKNLITIDGPFVSARHASASVVTTVGASVAVWRRGEATGNATIVAEIGGTARRRLTLGVRDADGLSFGCYGFTTLGESLRFVHGVAQRSSLGDADVAVTGPGRFEGTVPGYGCWGENFLAGNDGYHLVFGVGGRVLARDTRTAFATQLPYAAVDNAHPLEIESSDGETIRLHLTPAAGSYFFGWYEAIGGTTGR